MWRITLILLLLFITIKIAHGEDSFVMPLQQVIIDADKIANRVYKKYTNTRPLRKIEDMILLDGFKFVFKPKILKSIKKKESRYRVGFKFTF